MLKCLPQITMGQPLVYLKICTESRRTNLIRYVKKIKGVSTSKIISTHLFHFFLQVFSESLCHIKITYISDSNGQFNSRPQDIKPHTLTWDKPRQPVWRCAKQLVLFASQPRSDPFAVGLSKEFVHSVDAFFRYFQWIPVHSSFFNYYTLSYS